MEEVANSFPTAAEVASGLVDDLETDGSILEKLVIEQATPYEYVARLYVAGEEEYRFFHLTFPHPLEESG